MRILNQVMLVIVAVLLFSGTGWCAAGKKGSGLEGKVVDGDGKPLSGIKVVATQKEPLKGYEKFEAKTESDGSFALKGLYPESEYVIAPDVADTCNKEGAKKEIKSAPVDEVRSLKENIVVKILPLKVTKDGVITDPRTNLEWAPAPANDMNWNQADQYAQSLSLAGGGWRLPTIAELKTIYIPSCDGNIAHSAFNAGGMWAWSSQLDGPSRAWGFNFHRGDEYRNFRDLGRDLSNGNTRVLVVRSRR